MFNLIKKRTTKKTVKDVPKFEVLEYEYNKIVLDLEERYSQISKELEKDSTIRLNKNEILLALYTQLSEEFSKKDYRILLNVEYQKAIILLDENKYMDAVSHLSNGLGYLLYEYEIDFDSTRIDEINNRFNESSISNRFNQRFKRKENEIYKSQKRFLNRIQEAIIKGHLNRKEFVSSFMKYIFKNEISEKVNVHKLLRDINIYFDLEFFDINFGSNLEFSQVTQLNIHIYKEKIYELIQIFIKENNTEKIVQTLQSLYRLGVLHEECFGSYLFNCQIEVEKKIKTFAYYKHQYTGKRIEYKSPLEYYNQMQEEYINNLGKKIDLDFNTMHITKPFLTDTDYSLLDRYL